jgi:hypothetical protein
VALSVIIILYVVIGLMSAAGSVFIAKKLFSAKAEQTFFALFLIPIAGFYLAFTAYFGDEAAWHFETGGVIAFAVMSLVGVRAPVAVILGYLVHGLWDVLHEIYAHGAVELLGAQHATEIPLAYGAFCATYDWCMAGYFYIRWSEWSAAWLTRSRDSFPWITGSGCP